MVDIHTIASRRKNMSAVKSKNTSPELKIRKLLHGAGFRYSLHNKQLPGKPDLKFKKHRAVIFVNGCFWHKHNCYRFSWPQTREDFWKAKITGNAERDMRNYNDLFTEGWRVGVVWECALRGKIKLSEERVLYSLSEWLNSDAIKITIRGNSIS
ncbi:very short patch repair endonuclease [Robiginitomaculum antarcticum]|uniref:very short patch repair endonuclease n=1 Tax=Robiginitomaculum antarcticum TaxID=437507 RepID=UPI00036E5782|nr:very short patch repair endonuclease [Robiginitomaculum antarcticum]